MQLSRTHKVRNLNPSRQQYLHLLLGGKLLPLPEKLLHTIIVVNFEELFKAVPLSELFISVCQHAYVNHAQHVAPALL